MFKVPINNESEEQKLELVDESCSTATAGNVISHVIKCIDIKTINNKNAPMSNMIKTI